MQPAAARVTEVVELSAARHVRAARAGDERAFEAIVAARLPGAFRLAAAILGNEADAADATQNAFVAAWHELPRLHDDARFDAWFHRILVNECRMRTRHQSRVREITLRDGVGDAAAGPGVVSTLDRIEVLDLLEHAFEGLDAEDRAMVVMHHLEDRPLAEIASALHMPVGTVKWRLHEARRTLQQALEAQR